MALADDQTYVAAGHVLAYRMVPIVPLRAGIVTPPRHHPMAPRSRIAIESRTRLWVRFHASLPLQQWYNRYLLVLSRGKPDRTAP
jgi:hypothetical protein